MGGQEHWESVYQKKPTDAVSWYRPHLERSIQFLEDAGLSRDAAIIDVGGGASTFVDDALDRGYRDVTVLDLSATAIAATKSRLGTRADSVHWLLGDVTKIDLARQRFDFWHDRAVFHFLTDADARRRYVKAALDALKPSGHIVVATFGPEGPRACSGLPVVRYDPDALHAEFGPAFKKVSSCAEAHVTPWGTEQEFVYCYCRASDPDLIAREPSAVQSTCSWRWCRSDTCA